MVNLEIDYSKCDKCMECISVCPAEALIYAKDKFIFQEEDCTYCETCLDVCIPEAITLND